MRTMTRMLILCAVMLAALTATAQTTQTFTINGHTCGPTPVIDPVCDDVGITDASGNDGYIFLHYSTSGYSSYVTFPDVYIYNPNGTITMENYDNLNSGSIDPAVVLPQNIIQSCTDAPSNFNCTGSAYGTFSGTDALSTPLTGTFIFTYRTYKGCSSGRGAPCRKILQILNGNMSITRN